MPDAPKVNRYYPKNEGHIQSVRFKKDDWTKSEAKEYCKSKKYFVDGLDETDNEYRYRQYDPQYGKFNYFKQEGSKKGLYYIVAAPK